MSKYKKFQNPPIVEAVLDIQVELPEDFPVEELKGLHKNLPPKFPQNDIKKRFTKEFLFQGNLGERLVVDGSPESLSGYLFFSNDKKSVIQARKNGFSFSRLKPYDCWENLRDEAKTYWYKYKKVAKPLRITRLAVKYVNQLELPTPFEDFKEYLLTVPEIAPEVPQGLATYSMKLVIPHENQEDIAIIDQSLKPFNYEKSVVPIGFDLDVYRKVDISPDSDSIWDILEDLKNFENEIFFNSITKKLAETFDE